MLWAIKTQKVTLSNDGIIFSDTIPLSWFTSSVLIHWAKVLKVTVLDELPLIDGVLNKPWSSNLNKQTTDFEYCSLQLNDHLELTIDFDTVDLTKAVAANMPLWGNTYQIPFEEIRKIKMPCINIDPWGKDFYKITERVLINDLYERTPKILDYVIKHLLRED